MNTEQLKLLLAQLIGDWENEVVEFKSVGDSYSTSDIGKYFSALSNEANLRGHECGWLVFGVDNKTRSVVGSDYRLEKQRLHELKHQITQNASPPITAREIHELQTDKGRVVLIEIPPAPRGMPVSWNGHYYARAGESLVSLAIDKQDEIRGQTANVDWSAGIIEEATLNHLDSRALEVAKSAFHKKYSNRFDQEEVLSWPDDVFLNRLRVTIDGRITRTALLLLGHPESAHLLSPHPAELVWKLEGQERAYEQFGLPFLLNTTAIYNRIRNIQMRLLPDDQLIAVELSKYDQRIVLEALHNCIGHQDYERHGRVIVTEFPDRLVFESEGGFYDGAPDDYISGKKTPRSYRNTFLAQAMVQLNMIDTMGYGIRDMYVGQRNRFFPLPDYDLTESDSVKLTIHGKIVDPIFTRMLFNNSDLPFDQILALDRVQKRLPLDDESMIKNLRRSNLIEGRKPNLYLSAKMAAAVDSKEDYIHARGQDDMFYRKLIVDFLKKYGSASRGDLNKLLWNKLSDSLEDGQKETKIGNLLTRMRAAGIIVNDGSRRSPSWKLKNIRRSSEE